MRYTRQYLLHQCHFYTIILGLRTQVLWILVSTTNHITVSCILPCSGKTPQFGNGLFQESDFSDTVYNSAYVSDVQSLIAKRTLQQFFGKFFWHKIHVEVLDEIWNIQKRVFWKFLLIRAFWLRTAVYNSYTSIMLPFGATVWYKFIMIRNSNAVYTKLWYSGLCSSNNSSR